MRTPLLITLTITAALFTGAVIRLTQGEPASPTITEASPAAGQARIGGDFTLIDQNGKTLQAKELHGKLQLVFFGFINCPDICPVSLMTIGNVLEQLGDKASQITPVFITVDPARDTPEVLKQYMTNFHSSFIGLTGTEEQVKQATDAYKVYYSAGEKQPDGSYVVDHSGFIYLMDRDGAYLAHFRHSDPEQQMVAAIRPHLQ